MKMANTSFSGGGAGGGAFSASQAYVVGALAFLPFGMALGRGVASAAPHATLWSAGASTGLVPGMGEAAIFLSRARIISLHRTIESGVNFGGVIGAANLTWIAYRNRGRLGGLITSSEDEGNRNKPKIKQSRGRIGPTASHRTSKRSGLGKRRPRCKHVDRRGRRCLRPAGHSGRHRYV